MFIRFRPWYTDEDKIKLMQYAENIAKGNEITRVEIIRNVYNEDIIRIQFKTATENQKKYGFFTLHTRRKLLRKLPKKYQPEVI